MEKNIGKRQRNCLENIDRTPIFAYNIVMKENKRETMGIFLRILKIALILASMAMTVFIFSNSLKNAEQSSQQSTGVVDFVQKVASVIAPESQIATATGPAYDLLHSAIRSMAHFSEFFFLGVLYACTCLAYTFDKAWQAVPPLGVVSVAVADECLQLASNNRAFQFADLLLDVGGGVCGCVLAIFFTWVGWLIYQSVKEKRDKRRVIAELAASEQEK